MENPFESLERKINQRLDTLEALIREASTRQASRVGGIDLAKEITGLSSHAIYKLVARRAIPFSKPTGTRNLRFDEDRLREWLHAGDHKTAQEIEGQALTSFHP